MFKNMSFTKFCLIISIYFILLITIKNNVFSIFVVNGDSMMPNIKNKDIKIVNKMTKKYKRGDIVIAKDNKDKLLLIKRVVGLPGEKIDILEEDVYINNKKLDEPYLDKEYTSNDYYIRNIKLKEDEYYLMGDNRSDSMDSRELGPLKNKDIVGRCF
ncbi:signal peptidase I [Peptoniphilus timonensis]|uniref:signal peptidase I n=1 Tax=Peptoniphilus timonensis TaxID=1268254 RepID=UPI0002EB6DE4